MTSMWQVSPRVCPVRSTVGRAGAQRRNERRRAAGGSGSEVRGGGGSDEVATRREIVGRQERLEVDLVIAEPGVAVGVGQLLRLEDVVGARLLRRIEQIVGERLEHPEHRQQRGPLRPRAGLDDLVAAEGRADRLLVPGIESRDVLGGEDAGMVPAVGVTVRRRRESRRRAGDLARLPLPSSGVDPRGAAHGAVVAHRARCLHEALQDLRVRGVADQLARPRSRSAGQPLRRRGRPRLPEQALDAGDRGRRARHQRMAIARVADGVRENVAQLPRAVVAQQEQPRVHGAGHRGGEGACPGHEIETLGPQMRDRGAGRRRALAHEHARLLAGGLDEADEVTTRTVQMRFHDVQHESARDGRVEGVATALEHRLSGRGRRPVGRSRHAEGAGQRRPRREGGLFGVAHGVRMSPARSRPRPRRRCGGSPQRGSPRRPRSPARRPRCAHRCRGIPPAPSGRRSGSTVRARS